MRDMVIVGNGTMGSEIAHAVLSNKKMKCTLHGFVCDKEELFIEIEVHGQFRKIPILGAPSHFSVELFEKHVKKRSPHIVMTLDKERDGNLLRELSNCIKHGVEVHEGGTLYEDLTGKIPIKHIEEKWLIDSLAKPGFFYRIIKRTLDIVFSFIGLIVLSPLLLLICILVKLDSKGPAIYSQIRLGESEKEFKVYKFRTMVNNAEKGQAVWADKDDARVTRLGSLLRKTRLDELPQLFNVLKGNMSLVGPRPERPEFVKILEREIPFYSYRHIVKPGITGWAQVKYRYANCINSSLEKLQYDLFGIKRMSFFFDLKIIFRTILVVLTGKGAY